MKNRLGARSGRRRSISAARLRSIRATMVEHGEAGAEGYDHARRTGARPVQIGEREPRARAARAGPIGRTPASIRAARPASRTAARQGDADEDQPDPAVGDAGRAQAREAEDAERTGAPGSAPAASARAVRSGPGTCRPARPRGRAPAARSRRRARSAGRRRARSGAATDTSRSRPGPAAAGASSALSSQGAACPIARPSRLPSPASTRTCSR